MRVRKDREPVQQETHQAPCHSPDRNPAAPPPGSVDSNQNVIPSPPSPATGAAVTPCSESPLRRRADSGALGPSSTPPQHPRPSARARPSQRGRAPLPITAAPALGVERNTSPRGRAVSATVTGTATTLHCERRLLSCAAPDLSGSPSSRVALPSLSPVNAAEGGAVANAASAPRRPGLPSSLYGSPIDLSIDGAALPPQHGGEGTRSPQQQQQQQQFQTPSLHHTQAFQSSTSSVGLVSHRGPPPRPDRRLIANRSLSLQARGETVPFRSVHRSISCGRGGAAARWVTTGGGDSRLSSQRAEAPLKDSRGSPGSSAGLQLVPAANISSTGGEVSARKDDTGASLETMGNQSSSEGGATPQPWPWGHGGSTEGIDGPSPESARSPRIDSQDSGAADGADQTSANVADPLPSPQPTHRAEMDARDRDWVFKAPPNAQRTFFFAEDNIEFSSEFDSGNLIQVERVGVFKYHLYTAMDCSGDDRQTNNRQWFHFSVRGGIKGATVSVTVVGLLYGYMYTFDWMPVVAVLPNRPAYVRLPGKSLVIPLDAVPPTPGHPELVYRDPVERRRLLAAADPATAAEEGGGGGGGDAEEEEDEDGFGSPVDPGPGGVKAKAKKKKKPAAMSLIFDFRIDAEIPLKSGYPIGHPDCPAMYIASNHPYSYATLQRHLDTWQRAAASRAGVGAWPGKGVPAAPAGTVWNYPPNFAGAHQQDVYFHREVLAETLEGRLVDLITISDMSGIVGGEDGPERMPLLTFNGEATPVGLPHSSANNQTERPRRFQGKQYVVLSARVHAGECPGSHMMHGCFEFLMNAKDPRAIALRRHFVFFLVPMLNPDGVVRGHSRADANGVDLNRMYRAPSYRRHPVAYALWALLTSLAAERRLALYVDMHAHANKRGTFFYGNGMDAGAQVENLLYPKLVSLNTPYFDFKSCNYSESNMSAVTRSGLSKDCSCRVVLYTETGVIHSVAIEASYVVGKTLNPVVPLAGIPGEEIEVIASARYSPATFADTGKALLVALLDLKGLNPVSRVPLSPYQSMKGITLWLQRQLQIELAEKLFALAYKEHGRVEPTDASQTPVGAILAKLTPQDIPEKVTVRGGRHLPPTTVSRVMDFLPMELAATLLAQTPPSGPPRSFVCASQRRRCAPLPSSSPSASPTVASPTGLSSTSMTNAAVMATTCGGGGLGDAAEASRPSPVIAQPIGTSASVAASKRSGSQRT